MKCLIFITITFFTLIRGDPTLVQQNITTAYGSNFQNYVITQVEEKIIACSMNFSVLDKNSTIKVITLTLDLKEEIYYNIYKYDNRISSVGHDVCGFKVNNVTENDPSEFMINVIYSNYARGVNNWNSTFKINYESANDSDEKILNVYLGDKSEINCQISNQIDCLIINPQGEEMLIWKKPCIYKIYRVMRKDEGRWTCISSLSDRMESVQEQIVLHILTANETKISMVKTWYKEENGYGVIGCQYINENGVGELPEYCQFQMPDKNMLILKDTLATTRYTTFGLNLTDYICQLEFPLPILNTEKGVWTCYVGVTGGIINTDPKSEIPSVKEHEIWLQPNDDKGILATIEIFAKVPYMVDNCYIESPTGVTYINNILNSWLGHCRTPQIRLNLTLHVGEWKCHFSRRDRALDEIIKVQVRLSENIKTSASDDSVQSVELQCAVDYPIKQCRFQDPHGQTYHLTSTKQSGAISYYGRGLEHGECGIKITNPETYFSGKWTCFVRTKFAILGDLGEVKAVLKANVPSIVTGAASTIGIPIGIMSAALILLLVALYRRFRKSGQAAPARNSIDSNESRSNVPIQMQNMSVYTRDDTRISSDVE